MRASIRLAIHWYVFVNKMAHADILEQKSNKEGDLLVTLWKTFGVLNRVLPAHVINKILTNM